MNIIPKNGENLGKKITVTITQRDMLLLKMCLELVDQEYIIGGTLRFDIQSLRNKLSNEPERER